MPSLLDIQMMQNPVAAGLLQGPQQASGPAQGVAPPQMQSAPPQPAPGLLASPGGGGGAPPQPQGPQGASLLAAQRQGGGGGGLGGLFSGPNDPSLSDAQNKAIRKQSMMMAGLSMLASDRDGLGALAEGALFGQQVGAQNRSEAFERLLATTKLAREDAEIAQEQAEKDRLLQVRHQTLADIDFTDPAQRADAMSMLLQSQDFEGAEQISKYIQRIPTLKEIDTGDEIVLHDPFSGEDVKTYELPEKPLDTEVVDTGRFKRLIDSNSGEVIKEWDTWEGGRSPADIQEDMQQTFSNTNQLARDYSSEISDAKFVANAVTAGLNTGNDPAGDLTLISSLLRAQDPGATVRESDIENARNIGGYSARMQTTINQFADRGKLPEDKRQELKEELQRLAGQWQLTIADTQKRFRDRAEAANLNPAFVTYDPFELAMQQFAEQQAEQQAGQIPGVTPGVDAPTVEIFNRHVR